MSASELLEAFDAFLAAQGIEAKDAAKALGQFKRCGCGGGGISCADIVGCVVNGLDLEAVDCVTTITMLVMEADGTIVNQAGADATVTAILDDDGEPTGHFEITGSGLVQWWEITEQFCLDDDGEPVVRYTARGIGTKTLYAPAAEPCD